MNGNQSNDIVDLRLKVGRRKSNKIRNECEIM